MLSQTGLSMLVWLMGWGRSPTLDVLPSVSPDFRSRLTAPSM